MAKAQSEHEIGKLKEWCLACGCEPVDLRVSDQREAGLRTDPERRSEYRPGPPPAATPRPAGGEPLI